MTSFRFRFRSPERDKEGDTARISSVRRAIESAVLRAEDEMNGLSRRVEQGRTEAAFLCGNEISGGAFGDREAAQERKLRIAEERLRSGELRIAELRDHLAKLRAVEDVFEANFTNKTGGT